MPIDSDPRLAESKMIPMNEVIARLGIQGLRRQGAEMVGPCPICGGTDRFAVNLRTKLSNCRKCGLKAGDQVGLVREVLGLGFRDALAWLMGEAVPDLEPAEVERRRQAARERTAREQAEAEAYRARRKSLGRNIWARGGPPHTDDMRAYLAIRGFDPDLVRYLPTTLRFDPRLAYKKKIDGALRTLHVGPAMLARIDTATEDCAAVHCTWLDPGQPNGKALITERMTANKGEPWPAKLVFGSAKGGVIRLAGGARADTLMMGEGIETTMTALVHQPVANAAYWAGVSLGNMAGRMQRRPGVQHTGLPDLSDDRAFVPPPWVRRLIFIQDGDSAPKPTRAKLQAGLQRAMYHLPGLKAQIVHAGDGVDLNDLIRPDLEG